MNYAILTNGVVTSVIVLNDENAQDFPGAVKLGELPVAIGDSYANGMFYRDGAEVTLLDPETINPDTV